MSQATFSTEPYLNSNLFSGHYLDERVDSLDAWDCDEEVRDVFERLRTLWNAEKNLVESYEEDELLESWIDEVVDVLGFGKLSETTLPGGGGYTDRLLFNSTEKRREAAFERMEGRTGATYNLASALLEAKRWDACFTETFREQRSYRDASHQVKYYLERTPEHLQWGILTNGRKWRLYGTKDYETETYYEVDLPELLESSSFEDFKYFYVFFRFSAFRESNGTTFLDTVWNESETATQELGADLQDNVFIALRVLGKGFVETNDLDIGPGDDERLDELKEQSLVLLYRLMFILYAESRHLVNPGDPSSQREYEENFGLDQLRLGILEEVGNAPSENAFEREYSRYSTSMWSQLQNLFSLIDTGKESLGIPPYNGGLFDEDHHEFLAQNEVADRYLAEVIYRLSTTQTKDDFVPADYADLDTRHLGTIYEGLLEYEFRIAPAQYGAVTAGEGQVRKGTTDVSVADAVETVERGSLYVVNNDGERKATGAYYTPDYVVTYIVEETIDPLVKDVEDQLGETDLEPGTEEYVVAFWKRVTSLKVLDPAMGSGHFLTKATGYLAERVMERVRELETATLFDEQRVRREISRECIYGVDLNGMAVELAKLSMWLETFATNQPLAFLDHHLKVGNSLVGSNVNDVLRDDGEIVDDDGDDDTTRMTFAQVFKRARQRALEHVMELVRDLLAIDNEALADIKSMEEIYDEIRDDPLYQRLFGMANVHTAERFDLDVPEDAYERMARAIDDEDDWAEIEAIDWFRTAQATADDERFFHWVLEFPEVFFDEGGKSMEETGFDAVIGNPPWVDVKGLKKPEVLFDFFETSYNRVNIYAAFVEQASSVLVERGTFGFITPNSYLTQSSYLRLRKHVLASYGIDTIVRLPDGVFSGVTMETAILIARRGTSIENDDVTAIVYRRDDDISVISENGGTVRECNVERWKRTGEMIFDVFSSRLEKEVVQKIEEGSGRIEQQFESCLGLTPYDKHRGHTEEQIDERVFHSDRKESEGYHRITTGKGIRRYRLTWEGGEWIRYGGWLGAHREKRFFTEPRCIVRQIVSRDERGIHAAYFDEEMFHAQVGFVLLPKDGSEVRARNLVGILDSKLMTFYHRTRFLDENKDTFQKILIQDAIEFPLPSGYQGSNSLTYNVREMETLLERRSSLTLSLLDHLGISTEDGVTGPAITDIGLTQPPKGSGGSILHETTETKNNLKIERVAVERESTTTVEIELTVRYKPENSAEHETDRYGYTETEIVPALRITELAEVEADLIESFVPVAVDEAGGFAAFREKVTKTNSPLDRLKKLTLPDVGDVRDGLESYVRTKERVDELDEKIERTDDRIDEIVYELYGLTDEEIGIVEEATKE
ncbi:Eco57I restriction-modification methylase domain-containing protein [Haladaptatus halobius]|uniref:Eco57I restriction-modification methylase domain-containing protein n=1 Tax=Haladaptatus halobius TaxID=2884875 RepID=UPI001D0A34D6|nr:N-6 DNA methylase [Haladaptatus halobius]